MFRFNFSSHGNNDESDFGGSSSDVPSSPSNELVWLPAECVTPCSDFVPEDENCLSIYHCGRYHIKYLDVNAVIGKAISQASNIAAAEQNQSDLLPAKYEGGLKIWECTYDMSEYLLHEFTGQNLVGCHVLDLGCGAGLLGILALKLGASVTFQDYNKEVLETTTIPNVLVNLVPEEREKLLCNNIPSEDKPSQFYSGDWESFVECLQKNNMKTGGYFDYILSSETIYNPSNHRKLFSVFKRCLTRNGTVLLAAKTHYFGVGGGTRQFEDIVLNDGEMVSRVCWKSNGGVQREILEIKFKD